MGLFGLHGESPSYINTISLKQRRINNEKLKFKNIFNIFIEVFNAFDSTFLAVLSVTSAKLLTEKGCFVTVLADTDPNNRFSSNASDGFKNVFVHNAIIIFLLVCSMITLLQFQILTYSNVCFM